MNAELYILRNAGGKAALSNSELNAIANALRTSDTKLVYKTELDADEDRILECVIQSTDTNEKIDYVIIPNAFDGNVNTVIYRTLSDIVSHKHSSVKRRFTEKNGDGETELVKAEPIGEKQLENGCFFVINGVSFILLPKDKASVLEKMVKKAIPFVNERNEKRAKKAEEEAAKAEKKDDGLKLSGNEPTAEVQLKTYNRATISNGGKGSGSRIDANKITVIDNTDTDGVVLSGVREPKEKVGFFKERFVPLKTDSGKEKARKIILDLAIIVFIVTAVIILKLMVLDPVENSKKYDEIRDLVKTEAVEVATEITTDAEGHKVVIQVKQSKKWDKLKQINSEVVGWVTIDGTNIDYPVLQHPGDNDDGQFYLHRDIYRNYSGYGSIFLDYRSNKAVKSKNLILHGHHMNDGSMFQNLMGYGKYTADMSFYNDHPTIEFDTPDGDAVYKIISVFKTSTLDAHGDFFNYLVGSFESDAEFMNYVYLVRARSLINTGVTCNEKDQLLTLSTCSYEYSEFRTVVVARKTRVGEDSSVDTSRASANPNPLWPDVYYGFDDSKKPKVTTFKTESKNGRISWYDGKGNLKGKERMFTLHDEEDELASENASAAASATTPAATQQEVTQPQTQPPTQAPPTEEPEVKAESILFNYSTLVVPIGGSDKLEIYWTPSNVTDKSIKWESSNANIATISPGGLVKAKSPGECTITAETENGKKTSCKIVVTGRQATKLTISPSNYSTDKKGEQFKLTATVEPSNHTSTVKWTSSNTKVATVTSNGTVRTKGYGECRITASIDGLEVSCTVTVNKPSTPTQAPTKAPAPPTQAPTQPPTAAPTQAPEPTAQIEEKTDGE